MEYSQKILVVKLSAFGDFMISMGCFKSIRKRHENAKITLLTTKPFEGLALKTGYFDEIILDTKPRKYNVFGLKSLRDKIRSNSFDMVYDLQMNGRSSYYHRLIWDVPFLKKGTGAPKWAGIDKKAEFFTADKRYIQPAMHAITRNEDVLKVAGFEDEEILKPDLSWMKGDLSAFKLPKEFALIIAGCAPQNPEKRWAKEKFASICKTLADGKVTPVLIGRGAEKEINDYIEAQEPRVINLTDKTSFDDLAELGRKASLAIGNDTGPTHVVSMAGAPTIVLFNLKSSDPERSAPVGEKVHVLKAVDVNMIEPEDVIEAFSEINV
ncbi:MAG: ADP-heptose--LPS heptosyltransferase [Rickettsiales bacterium]|nr:ADP-heptose--LPS heptosyltransferase [Rickettsiales bacterium]